MSSVYITIKSFLLIFACIAMPFNARAVTIPLDISAIVSGCGDGSITFGEECDGLNLGGSSCSSLGFSGGVLSCSVSCTFNTTSCTNSSGGGGGGGGGGSSSDTSIEISGRAYPLSRISILKDGQLVVTTIAGPDGKFNTSISDLSTGNYIFSVYGEDNIGISSSPFTFPIYISSGVTTSIGGIFIAPTIALDKSQVRYGDTITIFGQTTPNSQVTVNINSEPSYFVTEDADEDGAYLLNFNSALLEYGSHSAKSKSQIGNEISPFGNAISFLVGNINIYNTHADQQNFSRKADLNNDLRVNLIDFSIAAFWYKRTLSPSFSLIESQKLNGDNTINLTDFSIMAYHWTG